MIPTNITAQEFDELSARHPQGGFQQTSQMRDLAAPRAQSSDIVGVKDADGAIVAGAMVVYTRGRFGLEGSIWLGPLCDPHNHALMAAMTDAIRSAAKRRGAVSVSCWPDVVYQRHESQGEPIGDPDTAAMREFAVNGWRHAGFTRGYDSVVNRWVYVKDLDDIHSDADLLASYAKNTRRNVKIAANSGVTVRRLNREELSVFHHICELSSERQHFSNRSVGYFEQVYDTFGEAAEFMVAEVHLSEYLATWQAKLQKFSAEVQRLEKSLETSKYPDDVRKKIAQAVKNRDAAVKRVEDAERRIERDGEVVPAAAGLFMWHQRELVYFSSGSDDRYAKFYAPTALQHEMMLQCLDRGVNRYNFYGISGVFDDPNDPGHGVLEFKQGFNGYVEELVGEFTLPVDKLRFGISEFAHKLLRR